MHRGRRGRTAGWNSRARANRRAVRPQRRRRTMLAVGDRPVANHRRDRVFEDQLLVAIVLQQH